MCQTRTAGRRSMTVVAYDYEATFHRHLDIVRFLLERAASVHITKATGRPYMNDECITPLHLAARNGQLAAAQLLVGEGAIAGVQNKGGWTPLHEASFHGHSDIIMLLLERAANGRARPTST